MAPKQLLSLPKSNFLHCSLENNEGGEAIPLAEVRHHHPRTASPAVTVTTPDANAETADAV